MDSNGVDRGCFRVSYSTSSFRSGKYPEVHADGSVGHTSIDPLTTRQQEALYQRRQRLPLPSSRPLHAVATLNGHLSKGKASFFTHRCCYVTPAKKKRDRRQRPGDLEAERLRNIPNPMNTSAQQFDQVRHSDSDNNHRPYLNSLLYFVVPLIPIYANHSALAHPPTQLL